MSSTTADRKLTKKEKKALAFRQNKGKGKPTLKDADLEAVPESEDLDVAEEDREALASGSAPVPSNKKRKRSADTDGGGATNDEADEVVAEDAEPKKKKRQRGKKKSQQTTGPDGQPKLLLFVGNLPYKVTAEDIKKHFEPTGEVPTVRLLTPKTPSSSTAPSKGCAFIQFTSAPALQAALRLHESTLGHRKINVELTAGGGGNSAARKTKIEEKRKALSEERDKVAENKKKTWGGKVVEGGAVVGDVPSGEDADKPKTRKSEIVVNGQVKKVRDRRLKKDPAVIEKEKQAKLAAKAKTAMTGANAIRLG